MMSDFSSQQRLDVGWDFSSFSQQPTYVKTEEKGTLTISFIFSLKVPQSNVQMKATLQIKTCSFARMKTKTKALIHPGLFLNYIMCDKRTHFVMRIIALVHSSHVFSEVKLSLRFRLGTKSASQTFHVMGNIQLLEDFFYSLAEPLLVSRLMWLLGVRVNDISCRSNWIDRLRVEMVRATTFPTISHGQFSVNSS